MREAINMADLSLDEIIGKNQGQNVKQRLFSLNVRPVQQQFQQKSFGSGFASQQFQQKTFRPKFASRLNRPGIGLLKRPFSAPAVIAKIGSAMNPNSAQTPSSGASAGVPGKGQIDARDMISIKNRIKIGDARMKILQKQMNKGNAGIAQPLPGPAGSQGFGPGSQQQFTSPQQAGFQPGPQPQGLPGPLRFTLLNEQGALLQQPQPGLDEQGPHMIQPRPTLLGTPLGPLFSLQTGPPMGLQQRPQFTSDQRPRFIQQQQRFPFNQQQRPPFSKQQRPPFNQQQRPPFTQQQRLPFNQQQRLPFNQKQESPYSLQGPPFNQQQALPFNQQRLQFNQQLKEFSQPVFHQQPPEFIPELFNQQPPLFLEQGSSFGPDESLQFNLDSQFECQNVHFNLNDSHEQPLGQQGPTGQQFNRPAPLFSERPSQMNQGTPNFMQPLLGCHPGQPSSFNLPPHGQGFNSGSKPNQQTPDFLQPPGSTRQQPPNFGQLPPAFSKPAVFKPELQEEDDIDLMPVNHTVVEDTGISLKITRTIPEVSFDGKNLTVRRRLPATSQLQAAQKAFATIGAGSNNFSVKSADASPKKKFQPIPIKAPSPPRNTVKTGGPTLSGNRSEVSSAGSAPVSSTQFQQPRNAKPMPARPGPPTATVDIASDTNVRTARQNTVPASGTVIRTVSKPRQQPSRLKPPPKTSASSSERLSALSRIQLPSQNTGSVFSRVQQQQPANPNPGQHQMQGASVLSRLSSPVPVTTCLAPFPAAPAPQQLVTVSQVSSGTRVAVKRPALSLSDRFASGGMGNPIPVVTDSAPVKKQRSSKSELEKASFGIEISMAQGQSMEEPGVTLLSPLQGFRILVSNLHSAVTQDDVIELFGTLGPLKRAKLLTTGQAEVAFIHKEHAVQALKTYHNRELDGQPMFLKLMTPLNVKLLQPAGSEDSTGTGLPPSLRTRKPLEQNSAPVEIPLIHKALFKTSTDLAAPSKAVRFTVKL